MTQEQFRTRVERAEKEVFVITATDGGWRVRSVRNPSQSYQVKESQNGLVCNCPDFQSHASDPNWSCKHVLAVERQNGTDFPPEEEPVETEQKSESADAGQMVIKRSLSPDGRIDSISIEISIPLAETVAQIKNKALNALKLQTEIVRNFLKATPTSDGIQPQPDNGKTNGGAIAARLLDLGVTNGQYGERFYINVDVNHRRARFFGSAGKIAHILAMFGQELIPEELEPGMRLDLPCRVLTERSADGKYLNVTQVLPPNGEAKVRP